MTKKEMRKKLDIMFQSALEGLERNVKAGRQFCAEGYRHDLATIVRTAKMLELIDYNQFEKLNNAVWNAYNAY